MSPSVQQNTCNVAAISDRLRAEDEDVCVGFLQDSAKRQFADELIAYANAFTKALYSPLMAHAAVSDEVGKAIA